MNNRTTSHIKDQWCLYSYLKGALWLVHQHPNRNKGEQLYITTLSSGKLVCGECHDPVPREVEDVSLLAGVRMPFLRE